MSETDVATANVEYVLERYQHYLTEPKNWEDDEWLDTRQARDEILNIIKEAKQHAVNELLMLYPPTNKFNRELNLTADRLMLDE